MRFCTSDQRVFLTTVRPYLNRDRLQGSKAGTRDTAPLTDLGGVALAPRRGLSEMAWTLNNAIRAPATPAAPRRQDFQSFRAYRVSPGVHHGEIATRKCTQAGLACALTLG
jgi:hypothetical protein